MTETDSGCLSVWVPEWGWSRSSLPLMATQLVQDIKTVGMSPWETRFLSRCNSSFSWAQWSVQWGVCDLFRVKITLWVFMYISGGRSFLFVTDLGIMMMQPYCSTRNKHDSQWNWHRGRRKEKWETGFTLVQEVCKDKYIPRFLNYMHHKIPFHTFFFVFLLSIKIKSLMI